MKTLAGRTPTPGLRRPALFSRGFEVRAGNHPPAMFKRKKQPIRSARSVVVRTLSANHLACPAHTPSSYFQ